MVPRLRSLPFEPTLLYPRTTLLKGSWDWVSHLPITIWCSLVKALNNMTPTHFSLYLFKCNYTDELKLKSSCSKTQTRPPQLPPPQKSDLTAAWWLSQPPPLPPHFPPQAFSPINLMSNLILVSTFHIIWTNTNGERKTKILSGQNGKFILHWRIRKPLSKWISQTKHSKTLNLPRYLANSCHWSQWSPNLQIGMLSFKRFRVSKLSEGQTAIKWGNQSSWLRVPVLFQIYFSEIEISRDVNGASLM